MPRPGRASAGIGETLTVPPGAPTTVTIRFRDPDAPNHAGLNPRVARVDLIAGDVRGPLVDRHAAINETTRVIARFGPGTWKRADGGAADEYEIVTTLPPIKGNIYVRVRGTNTTDLEPRMDTPGENPWNDLWFYSNPIFINAPRSENRIAPCATRLPGPLPSGSPTALRSARPPGATPL